MYLLSDEERALLVEIWKQVNEAWVGPKYRQFCADHSEHIEVIRALQAKELAINTAVGNEMHVVVKADALFYLPAEVWSEAAGHAEILLKSLRAMHKKNAEARFRVPDLCKETGLGPGQVFRGLTLLSKMSFPYSGVIDPSKDPGETWIQPTEDIFTIKSFAELYERRRKEHENRVAQLNNLRLSPLPGVLPSILPSPIQARQATRSMQVACDSCGGSRNHSVLAEVKEHQRAEDPASDVSFADCDWQIIRCSGCNATRFREYVVTSEDYLPGITQPRGTETLYPIPQRRKGLAFPNVPEEIADLYAQTVLAFNQGMRHLCAAGLRALVEALCAERGVSDGKVMDESTLQPRLRKGVEYRSDKLEGKIWGLTEKNLLTLNEAAILHKYRYLGNDALHEALAPTAESLESAVDVIEHMLEKVYELPVKAAKIQRASPKPD